MAPSKSNVVPWQKNLPKPLKFTRPSDWQDEEIPNPEYIVEDLIEIGTVTLLAGPGDIGKSFLCLQLMHACAVEQPWLGRAVKGCGAFGMFTEDPRRRMIIRQRAICQDMGIELRDLTDQVTYQCWDDLVGTDPTIFECDGWHHTGKRTDFWAQIEGHIDAYEPRIVFLDHVLKISRFQRNNQNQILSFTSFLHEAAHQHKIAIVLLMHPPKDRSAVFNGPDVWKNSVRNLLSFDMPATWSPDRPHEGADERVLKVIKNNNLANDHPLKTAGIPIKWQNGIPTLRDEPATLWPLGQIERQQLDYDVLRVITTMIEQKKRPVARDEASPASFPKRALATGWRKYGFNNLASAVDRLVDGGQLITVKCKTSSGRSWFVRPPDDKFRYLDEESSSGS